MDIPLPDDPPPPIKLLTPINIQLPPLEIELPSEKTEPPPLNIDLPSKASEHSENSKPSTDDAPEVDKSPLIENNLPLEESRTSSEFTPVLEIELPPVSSSSNRPLTDFVYSPSMSEPSQLEIELPSPINSPSIDNDLSSSQQGLEINLPPNSRSNPPEFDFNSSSKFTQMETDLVSPSGIDLPPSQPFAPSIEGNSSSKFPWDVELPSKAPLPPQDSLSPWEINLPSDNEKSSLLSIKSPVESKSSFSDIKASLLNIQPEMDIPMPDDPNRYSPSLPVDDDPPLEIIPPQLKGSRQSTALLPPPLPPLLPPSLGGSSTVLGRTKAKKRLMAFSMTKQGGGAGLSFALSKKAPPVSKDAVKVFDEKGDEGKKKGLKKGQSVDKARDTISEIEELKRKEMMLRENMQVLHPRWGNRDSHLYPIAGMLPLPEIVDTKKTEEIESIVGELLAKKEKKKDDRRSGSEERDRHHRSSKSKRSDRDKERERRKKKPKTLPLDWKEFKRDGHKVHHFRRFKFEVSKLESKEKRRHRRGSRDRDRDRRSRSKDREKKDSKSSSSTQPTDGKINLLETPMEIRNVLVALSVREDKDLEFPEFLVNYTKTKPQLSYSENPRFATYHFMSRKEMLATVPLDIEEIIFKFLGSIKPKRLKIKSETKELDSKVDDDEAKKDLEVNIDEVIKTEEIMTTNEISEQKEDQKNVETNSESIEVSELPVEVNKDESEKKTEVKKERKSSCKKLHRNWYSPWKSSQLVPQYFTPNIDDEVEIEEVLECSGDTTSSATILSEMKESGVEIIESVYPSRKRNISKSSDTAVITEELEPIIRTAIRSKWDSDYEDSQDGLEMEKKIEDVPVGKDVTPVTNGMDVVKEDVTEEIDDDNLGVVPMEIVEERNDEVEEFDNSFEESDKVEPANVVEKLASEYEEFMKMVSFENKEEEKAENSVEDMIADEDEYEDSKHSEQLNDSLEDNIDKHKSFAEYLAEIENVAKKQTLDVEDKDGSIDKELWETKRLYFNRSRSASPGESGMSNKEHEVDKKEKSAEKGKEGKKKNKKKKVQASKIKKKSKDKKQKKKKKKYSSSDSSSSTSSDESSDESSSSESSSSSDSSSESSSSSSSDSSVDRKKSRKKKKIDKLKEKLKSKKNKKSISSSSSEDDEDEDEDKRKKEKKRKKKKVERKKKTKVDSVKKLKDKKGKKKRNRESSEEEEPSLKKIKKNKKSKKKEEILSLENSKRKSSKKKTGEKKPKEKRLEKELDLPLTNSLKRLSYGKEDSETPRKKVKPEKDLNFENISDAEISRFFDTQFKEKQKSKDDDSKIEAEIDEDFKKSKEYRRMKKRELDVEDTTDTLTKEFKPKSSTMPKKSSKSFLEDTFEEFEESNLKSKEYFFASEKKEKKLNKEKSKKDFVPLDLHDESSKKQPKDDVKKIIKSKDLWEHVMEDKEERSKPKTDKDVVVKTKKNEKDEDDISSRTSSKNKKKVKKEKKKKDSDGNKSKKKKRKKKTKNSPKANSLDSTKDEMESDENHIHFLRDENFLFELGKDKSNVGDTSNAVSKSFDAKFSDYDESCDKSFNSSRLKNDEDRKNNEDNSNGSVRTRNLDWHDDCETRGSIIRRLQTTGDSERVKDESNTSGHNSVLLSVQYGSEGDEKSNTSECEKVVDSSKSLSKKDLDLIQFSDNSEKKPLSSSPLHQSQSPFNIASVDESDDDSTPKEKENIENRSPESSLGDIELESQDNSFVLEKDLITKSYDDIPESIVKKGVFSEVSIKENEDSISDNFKIQEETFKLGTNDSDRYSPTLDLDLLSPSSLTGEGKIGSDMSLDSNEPDDSLGEVKKSSEGLNMLDIPLPPPTPPSVVIPLQQPPPILYPAPVPPPLLRPPLAATSSFKNILNIPPITPPSPQVETKTIELQINSTRKEPIRLPLTNTRLTLNKPLVKVKPANIFEDDDDDESNSLGKNLIDSPEKEVQPSLNESESKFDEQAKKKRSRWGMEPEDELPIVKLYLANEVVKQTPSVDEAIYNESQTSKEISDDTSLFDKEKSLVVEKKFDDDNKMEDGIVNEKRDMQLIEVSNIDVENAQEAWKDQENFSTVQEEQNSESIEISRNIDKQTTDPDVSESVSTAQTKNQGKIDDIKEGADSNKRNNENFDNSNVPLDSGLISNQLDKLPVEWSTEEFPKTDSRHERSKSRTDESHRRKDYSEDRTRSSRRRDSRDRRQRRDSSRDRREYSRSDRSRSKERRRDRSRDRYRKRDYPDRTGKKRDRSRDRRRRDSPRDRKREKSPRRREGSRDSPRRRGDIKESPRRREDIKESPKKKEDTKESPEKRDSPGKFEESRERKPQIVTGNQEETDSESSEDEEIENNVEDMVMKIKEEPVDDGYEITKENISESKKCEQIIPTKIESKPLETISKHKEVVLPPPPEPKTQKIKINLKNPKMDTVPRKASPLGFKRSLADSTISDSELIPVKKLIRTSVCLSPKRLSLDDRIELELGVKKSPPPPPAPQVLHHQTYYQIPVHDGSQLTPQVLPVSQPRRAPTTLVQPPRVDWDAEMFAAASRPLPVPPAKSQVLQVGNMLQVVPTEMAVVPAPPTPTPAPAPAPVPVAAPIIQPDNLQQLSKVLQIGNMIQVVPSTAVPTLTPAQIFANAIANAVASVASSKPSPLVPKLDPSPVVKPTLPVAPTLPTVPVVPPSPEEQVLQKHMSPLLLPLPVAKKAISLPPLPEGDTRRQEKERRKREKEMRRQQKQKKATKKMIREALLMKEALESSDMENDDVRLSEEEGTDEEEPAVTPDVLTTPVRNKFFSPLPPPPGKGILVSPGFREKPVLVTKPIETRKVSFADGVHPGEGTSPSASEEHPHSPPPQPSNPKDKRYKKKKKKRKVKVRIIRVEEGDDDDDDDDGSPPPPPPGSPPPMFHYPPPPPGFMYAPPPSFTVLQGSGDGQTFAPVYQQHHSSTTTTHTTTVQFAPPPPPPVSKHARK